jgi:hypothetical protein
LFSPPNVKSVVPGVRDEIIGFTISPPRSCCYHYQYVFCSCSSSISSPHQSQIPSVANDVKQENHVEIPAYHRRLNVQNLMDAHVSELKTIVPIIVIQKKTSPVETNVFLMMKYVRSHMAQHVSKAMWRGTTTMTEQIWMPKNTLIRIRSYKIELL